jgi:hypothetical protein
MTRITALTALAAITASLLFTGTAEAQAITPLEAEPVSLSVNGNQHIFDHASVPDVCSITVDRAGTPSCIERISDWICPSGNGTNPLSADARARYSPTYADSIANPVTPRAYLNTHCLLISTRPLAVPAPSVACREGEQVAMNSAGDLVCAVPAAAATPVAVPSFTG